MRIQEYQLKGAGTIGLKMFNWLTWMVNLEEECNYQRGSTRTSTFLMASGLLMPRERRSRVKLVD